MDSEKEAWVNGIVKKQPKASVRFLETVWHTAQSWHANNAAKILIARWASKQCSQGSTRTLNARDVIQIRQFATRQSMAREGRRFKVFSNKGSILSNALAQSKLLGYLQALDPRRKLPKYEAEVKCPKCKEDQYITAMAIQTRRADEMQVMQYECSNHRPHHTWKG